LNDPDNPLFLAQLLENIVRIIIKTILAAGACKKD
jgi:hypothetical protein